MAAQERNSVTLNDNLWRMADEAIMKGRTNPEKGMALAEAVLAEAKHSGDHGAISHAWFALCVCHNLASDFSGTLRLIQEAKLTFASWMVPAPLSVELMNVQGSAYRHLGFHNVAMNCFLDAKKSLSENEDPRIVASLYNNLGLAYCELGMFDKGVELLQQFEELNPGETFGNIQAKNNSGYILNEARRFEEALKKLDTALKSASDTDNLILRSSVQDNRGVALAALGMSEDADAAFRDALELVKTNATPNNAVETHIHYAEFLLETGRLKEAAAVCDTAKSIGSKIIEASFKGKLLSVNAQILEGLERWQEAATVRREYMSLNPSRQISTGREFLLDRQLSEERSEVLTLEFKLRKRAEELVQAQSVLIESLAAVLEARNVDTGIHVRRTGRYVTLMAGELLRNEAEGIAPDEAETYGKVAALHDIGKVGISDSILLKEGLFNDEERSEMQRHVEIGSGILGKILWLSSDSPLAKAAREVIGSHHERWNGSGYPEGLIGSVIPMGGRIMAVADVYDAIRSERPYKEAQSHANAVEFIRAQAGILFDPAVVQAFITLESQFDSIFQSRQ